MSPTSLVGVRDDVMGLETLASENPFTSHVIIMYISFKGYIFYNTIY